MSLLSKLFPFLYKKSFRLKEGHTIEHCFTSGGVDYFAFTNDFKIPIERAHAAQEVYDSMEWRVDRLYLESLIASIRIKCNKGDLVGVVSDVSMLEERMKNIHNITMLYKLASIYYFDANENAYEYDHEYNERKIKHWIENKTFDSFFLSAHMKDLLPSFKAYEGFFQTYFKAENVELKSQLNTLLSTIQSGNINNGLDLKLSTQIKILQELVEKV
jgi:hypothetical protein